MHLEPNIQLNVNHTNRMRPYGEWSKVTCNYLLFISSYLGVLLYIFIKTKENTIVTILQASSKIVAFVRLWPKTGLVLNQKNVHNDCVIYEYEFNTVISLNLVKWLLSCV